MNADVRKAQENLTVAFKELHLGKPLAAAKQLEFQKEQIKKLTKQKTTRKNLIPSQIKSMIKQHTPRKE